MAQKKKNQSGRLSAVRSNELLCCPFCGSKAMIFLKKRKLITGGSDTLFSVQCSLRECGAVFAKVRMRRDTRY